MQDAGKSPEQATANRSLPMAMRVANAMHKIGVAGLPRNYEIFYAAVTGTNLELKKELFDSRNNIDQLFLDSLFTKYCARADDEKLVVKICDAIENKLHDTITIIKSEQNSVTQYEKVLGQASQRLDPKTRMAPEVMNRLVNLLASATEATQKQGKQTLQDIQTNSSQLSSMKTQLAEYKKLAETDALTGLYNRRAFDNRLAELKGEDFGKSALIIGDIDNFKALNDTYGHPFGDLVIKQIAHIIRTNVREESLIARVGGEEFALLSSNIDENGMVQLAERLRVAISEASYSDGRTKIGPGRITISIGVCHGSLASNNQTLYSQTDEALYASKRGGRNQVTSFRTVGDSPVRKNLYLYK